MNSPKVKTTQNPRVTCRVTKGSHTRVVTGRDGDIVRYETDDGDERWCWLNDWIKWCQDANVFEYASSPID